jgi:hypothetical protein
MPHSEMLLEDETSITERAYEIPRMSSPYKTQHREIVSQIVVISIAERSR